MQGDLLSIRMEEALCGSGNLGAAQLIPCYIFAIQHCKVRIWHDSDI